MLSTRAMAARQRIARPFAVVDALGTVLAYCADVATARAMRLATGAASIHCIHRRRGRTYVSDLDPLAVPLRDELNKT